MIARVADFKFRDLQQCLAMVGWELPPDSTGWVRTDTDGTGRDVLCDTPVDHTDERFRFRGNLTLLAASMRQLVLIVALTSFACGGGSVPTTPTPTVSAVSVSGNTSFTDRGQTSQFTATAILSNGLMQDQTRAAAWSSSNTAVASVSLTGLVTSIGSGMAQVSATYQGVSGTKTVNVTVPTPTPTPTPNPTPALTATFSSIQHEIFESADSAGRRACVPCHTNTGRNPAGGLNLNHDGAYDQLVNVPSAGRPGAMRVVPGDPDNSYIIHKLEGQADFVGGRMPPGGPFLTDDQMQIIRRWIQLGAKND